MKSVKIISLDGLCYARIQIKNHNKIFQQSLTLERLSAEEWKMAKACLI